jgi:hypothetical protein
MGDYARSKHIVTIFLACQITIKNVLTVNGKTTSDSYTSTPKSSCAQNVVDLKWSASLAPNPCTAVGRATFWQRGWLMSLQKTCRLYLISTCFVFLFFLSDLNIYSTFISNLYDGCLAIVLYLNVVDLLITSSIIGEVFFQLRWWHYHYISIVSRLVGCK